MSAAVTLSDITLARDRLAAHLTPTPLEAAPGLGEAVWLKLENTNRTHSFKIRGALNALLALDDATRQRGIITASSGNHAQGVAYAARLLGVRAQVLMAQHTVRRKVSAVERLGAEAILFGEQFEAAEAEAQRRAVADHLTYISAYNDAHVVAGGGTVGLEIFDALPTVEQVLVPVGGGGLISGIAVALKRLNPSIRIIGVNAAVSPDMYNAFYGTALSTTHDTLADALPGAIEPGSITLELVKQFVDALVCVSEAEIAGGMRYLLGEQGWLVEGAGAVGAAALQAGIVQADKVTAVVISGGNVGIDTLKRVL